MNRQTYLLATATIFAIIGLLHLARIVFGWEALIGGWAVPAWASWLALAVSAILAFWGFRLALRSGPDTRSWG